MIRQMISRLRQKWSYREIDSLIYSPALKRAYLTGSVAGGTLKDQTVAITGATGGIGKAVAERFIREGCRVVVLGRDEKKLEQLKIEIGNSNVLYAMLDLSEPETLHRKVEAIMELSPIDIWVNCAGVFLDADRCKTEESHSENHFRKTMDINYNATATIAEFVADEMVARNIKGTIINVTSMASYDHVLFNTPYGMSKAALSAHTKLLAEKYKCKLSVIGIAPGATISGMSKLNVGDNFSNNVGGLNRLLMPEEIAATIAFMASQRNHLSGEIIKEFAYNIH